MSSRFLYLISALLLIIKINTVTITDKRATLSAVINPFNTSNTLSIYNSPLTKDLL